LKILILHGPNLNLLGTREPEVYGSMTMDDINHKMIALGKELGADVTCLQSNHEGALIDALHDARTWLRVWYSTRAGIRILRLHYGMQSLRFKSLSSRCIFRTCTRAKSFGIPRWCRGVQGQGDGFWLEVI